MGTINEKKKEEFLSFSLITFSDEDCDDTELTLPNQPEITYLVQPNIFRIWLWFYFGLSIAWFILSCFLIKSMITNFLQLLQIFVLYQILKLILAFFSYSTKTIAMFEFSRVYLVHNGH